MAIKRLRARHIQQHCRENNLYFETFNNERTYYYPSIGLNKSQIEIVTLKQAHLFIAKVESVTILGKGFILTENDHILIQNLTYSTDLDIVYTYDLNDYSIRKLDSYIELNLADNLQQIDEEVIFFWGHENLGHLIFEFLERFLIFQYKPELLDKKILVLETIPKRFLYLLYAIGIKYEQIIFAQKTCWVKSIYIPSSANYHGQIINNKKIDWHYYIWPDSIHYLRNKLLNSLTNLSLPTRHSLRQIYISRESVKTKHRKVSNLSEMDDFLQKYHIEEVFLEDYDMEKQLELISTANMIIIPAGQSSPMTMFAAKNAIIIELCSSQVLGMLPLKVHHYVLGLNYIRVDCECDTSDGTSELYANLIVPIKTLELTYLHMLKRFNSPPNYTYTSKQLDTQTN